jgi:hypothetical protein
MGLHFAGLTRSPITGPAGNIEYLAYLEKGSRFEVQGSTGMQDTELDIGLDSMINAVVGESET